MLLHRNKSIMEAEAEAEAVALKGDAEAYAIEIKAKAEVSTCLMKFGIMWEDVLLVS